MKHILSTITLAFIILGLSRAELAAVTSTFDSDTEGWLAIGDTASPVTFFATGGNPGGHVRIDDASGGGVIYFSAPAQFLGDFSAAYGTTLQFDLMQIYPGSPNQFDDEDVLLVGAGLTLAFDTASNPLNGAWSSYDVPLIETAGWHLNNLAGATPTRAQMRSVLADLTEVRIRAEYQSGSDTGALDNVRLASGPSALANISTRLRVETGDNVLIGGFIVTGTQPKKVMLRAIGPSLPLAGTLANPTLELFGPSGLITSNDNWQDSPNKQAIIDSTIPPSNNLESAIVAALPGNGTGYTAIVRGAGGGTGIGLVEVYDLDRTVDSQLANISSRGLVQTGDDVMIGGFILVGGGPRKVIVRAIGPSLPVPLKLSNPTLELHDGNGALIATNDNWRTGGQEAEIIGTTIPPSNDLESAIVSTIAPGNYTAIVRGKAGTTGVALVEVFALN